MDAYPAARLAKGSLKRQEESAHGILSPAKSVSHRG
jgi:hypothetical protein